MIDKSMMGSSATLLVLSLLHQREMYGYEIISELAARSEDAFRMQEGTLYPLLHTLEQDGRITAVLRQVGGRSRRYYRITSAGCALLAQKRSQWELINRMLQSLAAQPQEGCL